MLYDVLFIDLNVTLKPDLVQAALCVFNDQKEAQYAPLEPSFFPLDS